MVIRALDHVDQCYSQSDGKKIYSIISPLLKKGETVELSFDGVEFVPSSFINTALIALLEVVPFVIIRERLKFLNTNKQINEMIRSRFSFELASRPMTIAN